MIPLIVVIAVVVYFAAYRFYGGYLSRFFSLNDFNITPAHEINDGVDYVPAKRSLLLGQHFSAIAAAGPIVGPVLAGIWFGWLPAILWIIIGAVFIGGVHDLSSLVASIRHKGLSVGELVKRYMSPSSYILFLIFMWVTLLYLIIAFSDITAQTFKAVVGETGFGAGVAVTSGIYIFLGLAMGVLLRFFKLKVWMATLIFLPLVMVSVWLGQHFPASILGYLSGLSVKDWDMMLLGYCFIASVIPVWTLLQPRGYLGGWLLYITLGVSVIGVLFGGFDINFPALNLDGFRSAFNDKSLFPILFITIACGACSGFHGIVSSGTTSKQLDKESDAVAIGYGGMLLEGVVAIMALVSVMILAKDGALIKADPNIVYASAIAKYLNLFGVDLNIALAFALLAFSTFVYDSLDVCTRLARYILQELFNWRTRTASYFATFASLLFPALFLLLTKEKGYLVAWPVFGTSNQLLASLILLSVCVWLSRTGRNILFALIPMIFMMTTSLFSLFLLVKPFYSGAMTADTTIAGIVGTLLFIMALWLIKEAVTILYFRKA